MFRMRLAVLSLLICCGLWAFGCSSGSSGPSGPDDEGNGGLDARESKSSTIGTNGGTIGLSSGTSVVFPAGAVDSDVTYTVRDIDPAGYSEFDASLGRVVVECTGPVTEFDEAVEIRVPLPDGMTVSDSSRVFGGYIDEATGTKEMQHCSIRMIDGKPFGILPLYHFSTGFLEWLLGETPPSSAGPLEIPYYGQGSSYYCWAASLQMVTQAASFGDRNEVTDIIGEVGVNEDGISSIGFRTNATIASIVKSRTGVSPDRCSWDGVNYSVMKDYLKRELGVRGYPVAIHSTVWHHAVVVVGYNGNTFYIHDPASTTDSAIGYTAKSWSDMVKGMCAGEFMVCLSVPKTLDSARPSVTVNIMNGAIQFSRPRTTDDPMSRVYNFMWDYRNENGYSYQDQRELSAVSALPGEVTVLKKGGDIEIVNSSRTVAEEVSVWLDIVCLGHKGAYFSDNKRITIPANSSGKFRFADVPVDEFRWNAENPMEYSFIVRALVGGSLVEEESVQFKIDSRPLEITSMNPNRGGPGTVVTLNGTGFGSIPKFTEITFNGIVAEVDSSSWSNTSIQVKVPENATTGKVVVKNGDVTANAGEFTVTKEITINEYIAYQTDASFGDLVMTANVSIRLNGEVVDSLSGEDNHYSWEVTKNTPASLNISGNAQLNRYSEVIMGSNGSKTVYTYHEPHLVPLTDTEYDNWPLTISGEFDRSVSENGIVFSLDDYSDNVTVAVVYQVTFDYQSYDEKGALVDEQLDQFYNSRTIGILRVRAQ